MPHPASNTPSGIRAGMGRLSEKMPKSGCTIEELTVAAKTRAPAAAREIPRSAVRKGTSAATAPWFRSVKRWPADSPAIALRSTPLLEVSLKSPVLLRLRPQPQMLSVFRDLVRRERQSAASAKLRESPPRLPYRVEGRPGGVSRRRTPAAGRVDLD